MKPLHLDETDKVHTCKEMVTYDACSSLMLYPHSVNVYTEYIREVMCMYYKAIAGHLACSLRVEWHI
mgnify:CR=1 FL=1